MRRVLSPRAGSIATVLAFAVALPVATGSLMPKLLTGTDSLIIAEGLALAIAALSLNLLLGYAGQISLGQAGLLGSGAFTSGVVTSKLGLSLLLGAAAGTVTAALIAFLLGLPALRLRGLYLAMVTIGFGYAMQESVFRLSYLSAGSAGMPMPRNFAFGLTLVNNADYLSVCAVALVAVWVVDQNLIRTKLGRAFQAIREDEPVAQSFGVDVTRYKLLAFTLSGAFAGLGGALYGHAIGFVSNSTFDLNLSLLLLAVVVVAGLGSRAAVVAAALGFTILPSLISGLADYQYIIGAVLLMYTISRHPGGLAELARGLGESREARQLRRQEHTALEPEEVAAGWPSLSLPVSRAADVTARATPADRDAPVLAAQDICVRFGGLQVLDHATLVVPQGRIVGLIGPNGAGKTTLFNTVCGLVRPDSGTVTFRGEEISALRPDQRARMGIARSFQLIGLAKRLSVLDNFLLAQHQWATYSPSAALAGLPAVARRERELRERAMAAVALLGFERYLHTPAGNLSQGQQRLVEMGCLLLRAPDLVMLDEPSAGMSPAAVENLAVRLRALRTDLGRTVLLIEHNIPLVLDVCDDVYVLDVGRVIAHGPGSSVVTQPEVMSAYLGQAVPA